MSPEWPLETERLTLRPWEDGDFEAFAEIHAAPETSQWLYNDPRSREEASAHFERKRQSWLDEEGDWLSCAGIERATGTLVADFAFHWVSVPHRTGEVGYITAPAHKGKGFAAEGARALLDWAFRDGGFHRVIGRIEARNVASARVLEKLGMRREALFVENEWVKGEWQSESVYAILEREWPPAPDA
jgi:RimJ/RimL family protein N-acetyltransferase